MLKSLVITQQILPLDNGLLRKAVALQQKVVLPMQKVHTAKLLTMAVTSKAIKPKQLVLALMQKVQLQQYLAHKATQKVDILLRLAVLSTQKVLRISKIPQENLFTSQVMAPLMQEAMPIHQIGMATLGLLVTYMQALHLAKTKTREVKSWQLKNLFQNNLMEQL